jgi:hypothetical protein
MTSFKITHTGTDLDGHPYYWTQVESALGPKTKVFRADELIGIPGQKFLESYGADTSRRAISEALSRAPGQTRFVVNRVGWVVHKNRWHYATGRRVYGPYANQMYLADELSVHEHDWTQKGSITEWDSEIKRALYDNPLLIVAVATAMTAPLLSWLDIARRDGKGPSSNPIEPFVIFISGEPGKGKTTALALAAATYGGGHGTTLGRMHRANRSASQLAPLLLPADGGALFVDDPRYGGPDQTAVAKVIEHWIFAAVARSTRATPEMQASPFWTLMHMTAQESISNLSRRAGQFDDNALAGRVMHLPATRRYGAFDRVPDHLSAAKFADQLVGLTREIYGQPIHEVLTRLVDRLNDDDERENVLKLFEDERATLKAELGTDDLTDGAERRREHFVNACAGILILRRWKLIPITSAELVEAFKTMFYASERVMRPHRQAGSLCDAVRHFVKSRHDDLIDATRPLTIDDREFDEALGFIRRGRGSIQEICLTPRCTESLFPTRLYPKTEWDELERQGHMLCDRECDFESGELKRKRNFVKRQVRAGRHERFLVLRFSGNTETA